MRNLRGLMTMAMVAHWRVRAAMAMQVPLQPTLPSSHLMAGARRSGPAPDPQEDNPGRGSLW